MSRGTTLGTSNRSRCAVAAAAAVVAVAATLVLPGAAHAAYRHRAESGYDTTSPKSVTATCGADEVLIGAGGRIRNGNGGVRLAAIVPGATSVEVRGEAYPDHAEPWSVIAAAICESDDGTARVVEVSPAGSQTASCPADLVLSGTGFDLPAGVPLAGLVPDADGASVTVRTAFHRIGASPVAYAVCVEGSRASWEDSGVFRYKRFATTSPVGTSSPRTVTVQREWEWEFPSMSGVGGEITVLPSLSNPFPAPASDIFIDAMMPNDDGTRVTVAAVQRAGTDTGRSVRGGTPAGPSAADDELRTVPRYLTDDPKWMVTGYSTDHDIY
ncbi:hypothetical protein [Micromonospora sediminimaris]|uniref:PEGA domain-containing protein n=1 Tax=Micromonospora sediminimaris TaxID=547162 RepID=A0A9W5ULT1_9ACTN|nr:hypothetical protein [Micromonospora sediminimaris]GIJ31589.1 hypothetical protein Vse01_07370 [Micromonospora sediminimaris]SFC35476.1 hypothetical protein SAMN05216284_10457 [Micromonospora sediminimaris]